MKRMSLFFVGALAAGCSAQTSEEPAGAASSEVRIANCPTSFSLAFSNVEATAIPAEASIGGQTATLSQRDRAALAAIQAKFVAAGSFAVQAELSGKADGVCRYRQPSSFPNDTIKLYSKGGKDILEMTVDIEHRPFSDDFRVYAFPTSYSTAGFTFDSGSVLLDGVIGIPDGPNLVVKVGTARLDSALATASSSEARQAVKAAVDVMNGPEAKRTREITLADAPSSVAPKLKAAYKTLVDDLSNDSYGDEKDLDRGVYAVFKSAQDHTVVGYAVWVHGDNGDSGRGRVLGFDLAGRQIVDAEDSWAED